MGPGDEDDNDAEMREGDELMDEFIRHVRAGYGLSDPVDKVRARAFMDATRIDHDRHADDEPEPDDLTHRLPDQ